MSTATVDRRANRKTHSASPAEKMWTRHEVYELSDAGHFGTDKVSLIRGRIYTMPMPGPNHDYCLDALVEYLQSLIPAGHYHRQQKGLGVGKTTDPGPDYAIVAGSFRDYHDDHPHTAMFAAEVAVTSRQLDLVTKPGIYANAGVPEYWVIDVDERQIVIHRGPLADDIGSGGRYSSVVVFNDTDSIAPAFAPQSPILVSELLPRVQS